MNLVLPHPTGPTDPTGPTGPTARAHPLVGIALAAMVALAGLATVTVAAERPASASAATANLTVSPSSYVGGQSLRWQGNIGHPGVRTVVLQRYLGRPGDAWLDVDDFSARTRADGSFSFAYPAPDMLGISFRVKSGPYVTAPVVFNAKQQDLTIRVTGQGGGADDPGLVGAGETFGITIDTTPDDIFHSPSTDGLPVFEGRHLTLQKRIDGDSWKTIATTTVDNRGFGYVTGLSEPAGVTVYRVVEGDYLDGANQIGWTQSFPLHLYVGVVAQLAHALSDAGQHDGTPVTSTPPPIGGGATPTGAQTYRWAPSIWDFDWETGQSLTSPPSRGTSSKGWWLDYSSGGGRVIKRNGALLIDSKRHNSAGPGDFGTTRVTLQGQPLSQGRWETRLHLRNALERGGDDYDITAELVPARRSDYDCGAHNITIARISAFTDRFEFGVRNATQEWSGVAKAPSDPVRGSHNFAVEVSQDRITWYVDAKPVGTATDAKAYSGLPMTLRLSVAGDGTNEMDQVSLFSDWQRGFPIDGGPSLASRNKLTPSSAPDACS